MRCENPNSLTPEVQQRLNDALDSLYTSLGREEIAKRREVEKLQQSAEHMRRLGLNEDQIVMHVTKGRNKLATGKPKPRRRVRYERQGRLRKLTGV